MQKGKTMLYKNLIIDNTYQIMDEIGSGGMGVVYLAYHIRLRKYVVLKKIKNPNADVSLLRNEVDVLKSLHHPYLPQVYDFISYDGDLFTVIDYIDGCDIGWYLKNGYYFNEDQLIKWLRQSCEVLSYLHSHNVLHTDIKPGNIIITEEGDICLIDFGISINNTDQIKGMSRDYSSPEQIGNYRYLSVGEGTYMNLDARTDIYSIGATFYHMMTGICPNPYDASFCPLSYCNTGYSQPLVEIIEKSMKFDMSHRFSSVDDMAKAIDNMRKRDSRYRRYILIQLLASILSVLLIVSGLMMAITGYRDSVKTSFDSDYLSFTESVNSANTDEATREGLYILNNDSYSAYLGNEKKAEILHGIGECCYSDADYTNAEYYYGKALEFCDGLKDESLYYRDYAFSIIQTDLSQAQSFMEKVKGKFPDSAVIMLVQAEMDYRKGDYNAALVDATEALSCPVDNNSENVYAARVIIGNSYMKLNAPQNAVKAYTDAAVDKETVSLLRKTGEACIEYSRISKSRQYYEKAYECYKKLYDSYSATVDDVIQLAQACLYAENTVKYQDCKKILEDELSKSEDCRLYILLTDFCDKLSDVGGAKNYSEKARRLYLELNDNQRNIVTPESLRHIRDLYSKYNGEAW